MDLAKEGQHFYNRDGSPCYEIDGKKTTLREARKFKLYPGTTTIIAQARNFGLDAWKTDQVIMACLTMPKIEGESEQEYIKRLKEDAKEQARKAAEKGTDIHGYVERGFRGKILPDETGYMYFDSVANTIFNECGRQEWHAEKSFASSLGYGGKCDLHNDLYLIDFKGTDKDLATIKTWEEQSMQLAAYDAGLEGFVGRKCGICYVHRDTAESRLIWIPEKDLLKGWECFKCLLGHYFAKTGLER